MKNLSTTASYRNWTDDLLAWCSYWIQVHRPWRHYPMPLLHRHIHPWVTLGETRRLSSYIRKILYFCLGLIRPTCTLSFRDGSLHSTISLSLDTLNEPPVSMYSTFLLVSMETKVAMLRHIYDWTDSRNIHSISMRQNHIHHPFYVYNIQHCRLTVQFCHCTFRYTQWIILFDEQGNTIMWEGLLDHDPPQLCWVFWTGKSQQNWDGWSLWINVNWLVWGL